MDVHVQGFVLPMEEPVRAGQRVKLQAEGVVRRYDEHFEVEADVVQLVSGQGALGHSDDEWKGVAPRDAVRKVVVEGDDGHSYVPAEFFDGNGVPVQGWRRVEGEELAALGDAPTGGAGNGTG